LIPNTSPPHSEMTDYNQVSGTEASASVPGQPGQDPTASQSLPAPSFFLVL
jgi:hypothetical protein